jgi:tetratricopeptide (TPR) repeat protein
MTTSARERSWPFCEKSFQLNSSHRSPDDEMDDQTLHSATQLHQAGQLDQAEASYRQILARDPKHADALHLLGVIQIQRGQHAAAIDLIRQAIALRPNSPGYYSNLGWALTHSGRLNDALACYQKLVALQPTNAAAFDSLSRLLLNFGQIDEAIAASSAAVRLRPDIAQHYFHLANGYVHKNRYDLAVIADREATRLEPANPKYLHDLAVALAESGHREESIGLFDKTIELNPGFVWAYSSKGITLARLGRREEAMECMRRALEIDPNAPAGYNNFGSVLQEEGRWDEACEQFRKAVSLDPNSATARWNLARVLLILGHIKEGWAEFDSRLQLPHLNLKRNFTEPQWDGSDPTGKTILLHAEGGHGDALNFIRLVPQIARRGAKLILECQPSLVPLLERMPELDRVIARGQPLPPFDWQIPLQSLPHVLGLTLENIPNQVPYLSAPPDRVEKWKQRLAKETKVRVGLVWSGSVYAGGDSRTRTIDVFAPLAEVPGFKFFSLQKGKDSTQPPPPGMDWADYTAELHDFADTAALVQNLDLVVTIDTSVAHLAGALAKLVWVLIPFQSDFRWLLDRTDTPWYPTMRLFRQTKVGDWDTPIHELVTALRGFRRQ